MYKINHERYFMLQCLMSIGKILPCLFLASYVFVCFSFQHPPRYMYSDSNLSSTGGNRGNFPVIYSILVKPKVLL